MDKIRIAVVQDHSMHFASVDYAEELGYYKEFQVAAERIYFRSGGEAVEAVADGRADFLISCNPLTVALKVKAGGALSIIGSDGPGPLSGTCMVVRKDSEINSLRDLNGKTIGISSENSATHIYCQALSAKAKINLNIMPLGRNRVPFLEQGKVDAVVLVPDFSFRALASGKVKKVVDIREELGKMDESVLAASNQSISTKKDAITGALKGICKAADYIKKNRKEAIEFLIKFTGQEEKVANECYQEVLTERSSDGFIKKDNLEKYFKFLIQLGMKIDLPPVEKFFTGQFVPVKY